MDRIWKSPSEKFPRELDFSNDLASGESLSSYTLTCVDMSTGEDSSSTIISSSSKSGNVVTAIIQGGILEEFHQITVTGTTDLGNDFQKEILVEILEMIEGEFPIQPDDEFIIKLNFEEDLRNLSGEEITDFDIEIFNESGTDVADDIISGDPFIDDEDIYLAIEGPASIETYLLHGIATTTSGYIFDIFVRMRTVEL